MAVIYGMLIIRISWKYFIYRERKGKSFYGQFLIYNYGMALVNNFLLTNKTKCN